MGEFFVYILKSSVCLSVLYLFYRLLLSKETFYNFNRIAILGILIISLALPFCEITVNKHTEVQQGVLTLEQLLMMADYQSQEKAAVMNSQEVTTAIWIQVLLFTYLAGVVFFLFRNIYSLLRLMRLIRSSIKQKLQKGVWLISHSNPKYSPFSWMNFIVMSHSDMEEDNNAILVHEMAHIRKRHSIDLLITDVCIIFQWFNPAAWLFKQELQNIHEYQADEAVLDKGVNAKQYQLLLIKKAAGTRLYSMANSFNHSKLKKRITMMLKEKSNPWARLKYLYVLPVAAIAVTAFARPEISNELKEISAAKVNDLSVNVITESPEKVLPEISITDSEVSTPQPEVVPEKVNRTEKDIKITSEPQHVIKSDSLIIVEDVDGKREEVKVVGYGTQTKTESYHIVEPELPTVVKLYDAIPGSDPLIMVDGEQISQKLLSIIDPGQIESISVLKSESATDMYGVAAKNGVVLITTKANNAKSGILLGKREPDQKIHVNGTIKDEDGKPVIGASVLIKGTTVGTISNVDGKFILESPVDSEIAVMYIDMETAVVKAQPEVNIVLKPE